MHGDPKTFKWCTLTLILATEHGGPVGKPRIPHDLHVASKHLYHLKALLAYEDRPRVTRNDASGPAISAGVKWPAVGSTTRTPPGVSGAAISIKVLLPTPADLTRLRSQFKESVAPARMGHMEIIGLRGSCRQTCDLGYDMQLGRESYHEACVLLHLALGLGVKPQDLLLEV